MTSKMDFGDLVVERVIAHEVPRQRQNRPDEKPVYSEAVPDLPEDTLRFFGQRLKRTLLERGHAIEIHQEHQDPVIPTLVTEYLQTERTDEHLVTMSQRAASHLLASQPGSSHEDKSLFLACDVLVMGTPAVALMKLEREEGGHIRNKTIDDKTTLTVTVLRDLMLTEHTRLFKAAAFWFDQNRVVGHASDTQQGAPADIAGYFLARFLGCQLQRGADVLTEDFYNAVSEYINEKVTDQEKKLDYHRALQTEISSNRHELDPVQFVADHFSSDDQDPIRKHLSDLGVPEASFRKDSSRLRTRPTRSRLKTANGLTIAGESSQVSERVSTQEVDGVNSIVIRDRITGI